MLLLSITSEYAISEEEALARLDSFMAQFEGATRSTSRRVRSISHVSYEDVHVGTRSSEELDIENLLYIVEFEDGQGSAIIGADERVEPVYAVLDETVLTIEDFNNAANGTNTNDIRTFTAGMIAETANLDFGSGTTRAFTPILPPGFQTDSYVDIISYVDKNYIAPYLTTQWHQDSPFNDRFPVADEGYIYSTNGKFVAGCTTIALAQVLNYHAYPSNIVLNGRSHSWDNIGQFTFNVYIADDYLLDCMSRFIYDLAIELDVECQSNGTTAGFGDVQRVMIQQGYRNISYGTPSQSTIRTMLVNSKPVLFSGFMVDDPTTDENEYSGHSWVMDGWKTIETITTRVTYNAWGVEKSREVVNRYETDYVHCNMGYDGDANGYYTFNIFNLSSIKPEGKYEPNYGDNQNTVNATYTTNFEMLIYDTWN